MLDKMITEVSRQLKNRLAEINSQLNGEQIYVYESGTQYCVLALQNTSTFQIMARMPMNLVSRRDQDLAKLFLNLIEDTRTCVNLQPQKRLAA